MITDRQVENSIAFLLRAGVLLAACVVFLGGLLYLAQRGSTPVDYRVFHGEPAELRNPALTICSVLSGNSEAIIQTGLLLLVLTPIARVIFSVVAFARERDGLYVLMTLMVLAVLLYSLLAG